ncbi:hypothetical protein GIB67_000249 [Kingdonia uniflora]|uniref:Uncharacterized protein n=1 Tax=Kingdonia uniflora TaxID=39325 RepID=A0A7J7LC01_9MAGN|nr:hypothetical protein GIB67_000249 [Kingdonia uniflora]
MEAQSLVTLRQGLFTQIQQSTLELQKALAEVKIVPELLNEPNRLRQEHQKLWSTFEYEKDVNAEQVERMRAMGKNLVLMAGEVEKLRSEVLNAEKNIHASNPYRHQIEAPAIGAPAVVVPAIGSSSFATEIGAIVVRVCSQLEEHGKMLQKLDDHGKILHNHGKILEQIFISIVGDSTLPLGDTPLLGQYQFSTPEKITK